MLQGFDSKKGLDNAGFHVKCAGTKSFAGGDAEGHAGECASGVDGIVMAEDQELAVGARSRRGPDNAEMIATMFLFEDFDQRTTKHPLVGEEATATVRRMLFKAGGLKESEFTKRVQHIWETWAQNREKGLRKRELGH